MRDKNSFIRDGVRIIDVVSNVEANSTQILTVSDGTPVDFTREIQPVLNNRSLHQKQLLQILNKPQDFSILNYGLSVPY